MGERQARFRPATLWGVAALFWTFVAVLSLVQIWWLAQQVGERINIRSQVFSQGAFYGVWIPVTVFVWWLTGRWDVTALGWPALLARHVSLLIAISVAQAAAYLAIGGTVISRATEPFLPILVGTLRSRFYLQVVIYVAIVATGQAMTLYDRWRDHERRASQLEAQLSDARLEALRAQVHPHFLFNSLHTIASLVRDNRNADAVRLISGMSDLLRQVLSARDSRIRLDEEVELARRYLEIQDARFGDRITSSIEVDSSLAGALVPALVLQPLVENAIRHGLSSRVEGGAVRVRVDRLGSSVRIRVEDTGAGVPPGWSVDSTTGTGLRNLRARLNALYGTRATVTAGSSPSGGFRVEVTAPLDPI